MSQPSNNIGTNQSGATLNGLFKQVYAKNVVSAAPSFAILQKAIPFQKSKLLGDKYHIPVVLTLEQGFTYSNAQGAAYTLNSAVAMQMQDAQVSGAELTLQSGISYGAVSRAQSAGPEAVEGAVGLLFEQMKESYAKRIEIAMLYGSSVTGLGVISATSGSGTTRTYTILSSTYGDGIWSGLENSQLDVYYNTGTTGSQLNTNAAVIITAVNIVNQTVSVSGNSSDLTAIDAQVGSTAGTSATFYFYQAYGNEMSGVDVILLNTGTLFNINASTYNLWQANTYSCGSAQLTMGKVLAGLAVPCARGLMEDVTLFVNPTSFANLISDLSAQRRYDGTWSKTKLQNGSEGVEFYGQNGKIEVVSHAMIKRGEAFALPLDLILRVGSTDFTMRGEMIGGEETYLFQNPTGNAWTCRAYSDQAIVAELPAHCVKFTNIVPTT